MRGNRVFWVIFIVLFASAAPQRYIASHCTSAFTYSQGKVFSYQRVNRKGKELGKTVYVVKKQLSSETGNTTILAYQNYDAKGRGEGWGECFMICNDKCLKISAKPFVSSKEFQRDKSGSRSRKDEYLIYPKSLYVNMTLPPASVRVFAHAMSDDKFTFIRLDINKRRVAGKTEIDLGGEKLECYVIESRMEKESFTEGCERIIVNTELREYFNPQRGVVKREQLSDDGTVMDEETLAMNQ